MGSFLFFIGFTAASLLYRIFPSHISLRINMILISFISLCIFYVKLTPNRPMYDGRRGSVSKRINAYDMTGIIYLVSFLHFLAFLAEVMFEPISRECFIWMMYTITVIMIYVVPAVIYFRWRIKFYLDVRKKSEAQGWTLRANICEFIFTGRRNVHNITVVTSSGSQTIGILGGVGAMEYAIEGGTIKAKRVEPFDKKYAFLDYGGAEKKELHRWYRIKKRGIPLPESVGKAYLMIQPNAFVTSENFLVDVGEEVEGMRLLDMETGMKIVRA